MTYLGDLRRAIEGLSEAKERRPNRAFKAALGVELARVSVFAER